MECGPWLGRALGAATVAQAELAHSKEELRRAIYEGVVMPCRALRGMKMGWGTGDECVAP